MGSLKADTGNGIRKREAWLDYVRFFSIFLVILFHTPPRLPLMDDAVILNLRVPVFFCISGFLYDMGRWRSFGAYVAHRSRQILIPYTTFFIIFYVLWLAVGRDMVGAEEEAIPVTTPIVEFLSGNPKVVCAPFWYIACLFSMQIIYYLVERLVPRRAVFITCVAISLSTYLIYWNPPFERLPWLSMHFWNIGNAMLFLPFYALGNSFKPWLRRLSFSTPWRTMAWLALMAVSMAAMAFVITPVKPHDPHAYAMLRVLAGLLVIPAYMCIGKWVAQRLAPTADGKRMTLNRRVQFVVVSGTVYLGLQNYFIGLAKIALNRLCYDGVIDDNVWLKFVIAVVVMAVIYPFAWLIDRYAPWLIGKPHPHRFG